MPDRDFGDDFSLAAEVTGSPRRKCREERDNCRAARRFARCPADASGRGDSRRQLHRGVQSASERRLGWEGRRQGRAQAATPVDNRRWLRQDRRVAVRLMLDRIISWILWFVPSRATQEGEMQTQSASQPAYWMVILRKKRRAGARRASLISQPLRNKA